MAVFDASEYPDIAHLLPGSVLALITVIGIDATLMLIDRPLRRHHLSGRPRQDGDW